MLTIPLPGGNVIVSNDSENGMWRLEVTPRLTLLELHRFVEDKLMVGFKFKGNAERVTESVLYAAARHPSFTYCEHGPEMPLWARCLGRSSRDG